MRKKTGKRYTAEDLAEHPFSQAVLQDAIKIEAVIQEPDSVIKTDAKFKRLPTQAEFYCISTGNSLAQLLSICQQLEHSVLYFSSFSPTEKMKKAGISKQDHLLYCIENFIIRTQAMYDRLLRLIDKTFCLYNASYLISHELILSNIHIRNSAVPEKLKNVRKVIKDYHRDRNEIIHERQYLENDLRQLYVCTFMTTDKHFKNNQTFQRLAKYLTRHIVKGKTSAFTEVNNQAFVAIAELFDVLKVKYNRQRKILEAIYGKIDVLEEKD